MELKTHTIDAGRPGPHLLITGGVHGDEFEPMIALRRRARLPELAHLRGRLTLVPVVNEGALARGQRVAGDGLDLARSCPGRADGSVTEQTAFALSRLIGMADYYIDLHTGGTALMVWPLVGYMLHPHPVVLGRQREMARAFNLPVVWGTDAKLEGRSLSVARDAQIPAIYAEYEGGGRLSPAGVAAYVTGCVSVLRYLEMLPGLPAESPGSPAASQVRFFVEDPRPGSGHMQRCHPSPADGCFEPAVELGQPIEAGELLGEVVDPLGGVRHPVHAAESGRVLVLRTFPAVQKDDSLAVILPPNMPERRPSAAKIVSP